MRIGEESCWGLRWGLLRLYVRLEVPSADMDRVISTCTYMISRVLILTVLIAYRLWLIAQCAPQKDRGNFQKNNYFIAHLLCHPHKDGYWLELVNTLVINRSPSSIVAYIDFLRAIQTKHTDLWDLEEQFNIWKVNRPFSIFKSSKYYLICYLWNYCLQFLFVNFSIKI